MDKEQLVEAVGRIPRFEFRNVAVGNHVSAEAGEWAHDAKHRAITEVGSQQPLAYVSLRYALMDMQDMFLPMLEDLDILHGKVKYFEGRAVMDVYPAGDEYIIADSGAEIGISAYNSVDTSSGLIIRFVVRDSHGREIALPKKLAQYKKPHVGNIKQVTQDYLKMLNQVRSAWSSIVDKFSEYPIRKEEIAMLCESFGVGEKVAKKVDARVNIRSQWNLWDFCQVVFDELAQQKYTSDVHRRARMDEFCDAIFTYKLVAELRV